MKSLELALRSGGGFNWRLYVQSGVNTFTVYAATHKDSWVGVPVPAPFLSKCQPTAAYVAMMVLSTKVTTRIYSIIPIFTVIFLSSNKRMKLTFPWPIPSSSSLFGCIFWSKAFFSHVCLILNDNYGVLSTVSELLFNAFIFISASIHWDLNLWAERPLSKVIHWMKTQSRGSNYFGFMIQKIQLSACEEISVPPSHAQTIVAVVCRIHATFMCVKLC